MLTEQLKALYPDAENIHLAIGAHMQPRIKEKWCQALESGDFLQTGGTLHDESGYCCLGVLEALMTKEFDTKVEKHGEVFTYNDHDFLPPDAHLVQLFGTKSVPGIVIDGKYDTLSGHNDNGATFKQIAAAIREQI